MRELSYLLIIDHVEREIQSKFPTKSSLMHKPINANDIIIIEDDDDVILKAPAPPRLPQKPIPQELLHVTFNPDQGGHSTIGLDYQPHSKPRKRFKITPSRDDPPLKKIASTIPTTTPIQLTTPKTNIISSAMPQIINTASATYPKAKALPKNFSTQLFTLPLSNSLNIVQGSNTVPWVNTLNPFMPLHMRPANIMPMNTNFRILPVAQNNLMSINLPGMIQSRPLFQSAPFTMPINYQPVIQTNSNVGVPFPTIKISQCPKLSKLPLLPEVHVDKLTPKVVPTPTVMSTSPKKLKMVKNKKDRSSLSSGVKINPKKKREKQVVDKVEKISQHPPIAIVECEMNNHKVNIANKEIKLIVANGLDEDDGLIFSNPVEIFDMNATEAVSIF